jgi:SAM-dependent methyltransferase
MLAELEYRLLKRIAPHEPAHGTEEAYAGKSKLRTVVGDLLGDVRGLTVIDFGCGTGEQTIELAQCGARAVGVDIQEPLLARAREHARALGLGDRCTFTTSVSGPADMILSLDAFEHFGDPEAVLWTMHRILAPGGVVIASFGPTWFHPYGGHLFSVFPWAHLVFSERALIRWRADIRSDGATCFGDVTGGLNRMTIGRFEHLVRQSPFSLERLETVPIRLLAALHTRVTREFTTSIVRSRLRKVA